MGEKIRDLEDVSAFKLSDEDREKLFAVKNECTVCWTNKDGWPMGMPHDFVWSDGKFWVHTTTKRKRVKALTDRPKSCIVVSTAGTDLSGGMVSAKTMATVHHGDRDRVQWLLPLFFDRVGWAKDDETRAQLMELFDTPARVVIEFEPREMFTWSSREMSEALLSSGFGNWNRM